VAVSPKTGKIYVLAGKEEAISRYGFDYPAMLRGARLVRMSADGKEEMSLKIKDGFIRKRKKGTWPEYRVSMAVDFSGKKPVVWLGLAEPNARWAEWSLLRIEDLGNKFGKAVDVCPRPGNMLLDPPSKICLDRKNDVLYVVDEFKQLLRFKGDGSLLTPLKFRGEEKGAPFKHMIGEAVTGPDGNIYMLNFREWGYKNTYVMRFSPDGKPLPFSAPEAKNGIKIKNGMKGSTGARGIAVGADKKVYVIYYDLDRPDSLKPAEAWDRGYPQTQAVAVFDSTGKLLNPRLVAHLRAGGQCVRVDKSGNVFVADNFMPLGVTYPRDLARALPNPLKRGYPAMLADGRFDPLMYYMGSVLKFGPKGGTIAGLPENDKTRPARRPAGDLWKPVPQTQWFLFNNHRLRVTSALWQYHGFSHVPAQYHGVTHVERCVCRAGRFDVDGFGRVFIPDALRKRIVVLDNAGNVIQKIGGRGNLDNTKGPLTFDEPYAVAAAADRFYVADRSLGRIVRARIYYGAADSVVVER
jgi:hypothetical protein